MTKIKQKFFRKQGIARAFKFVNGIPQKIWEQHKDGEVKLMVNRMGVLVHGQYVWMTRCYRMM